MVLALGDHRPNMVVESALRARKITRASQGFDRQLPSRLTLLVCNLLVHPALVLLVCHHRFDRFECRF